MIIIIFGVSGAGKTTVGKLLARELGWRLIEADDFHPAANIEKMRSGHPLTDDDRWPWLERLRDQIRQSLAAGENAVLACSALKRAYRDRLQASEHVKFVFLRGDYALVDETYARWLRKLDDRLYAGVPPAVRANLLAFYGDRAAPTTTKKHDGDSRRVMRELEALRRNPPTRAAAR